MSSEELRIKLVGKFSERSRIGISELKATGTTQQLPVILRLLESVILTPRDWNELGNEGMLQLIDTAAEACGLYPLENDRYSWDLPADEREKLIPKPPTESRIEPKFIQPTYIQGHIPRATKGRRARGSDGTWDDPTYNLDDA